MGFFGLLVPERAGSCGMEFHFPSAPQDGQSSGWSAAFCERRGFGAHRCSSACLRASSLAKSLSCARLAASKAGRDLTRAQ